MARPSCNTWLFLAPLLAFACAPSRSPAVDAGVDAGTASDESCATYTPPRESATCEDRARTPLTISVVGCSESELQQFEGTLLTAEAMTQSNGVRLRFEVGTKHCAVEVSDVGSAIAQDLPQGVPVLGAVNLAPEVPNSFVAVASQAGRQCLGESNVRFPPLFLAVDGLAKNVKVTGPALDFDVDLGADRCAPTSCQTPRTTTGCTFCQTADQGCWAYRSGLVVASGVGCAALVPTSVGLDETKTLTGDGELRAKLLWGLFQRECDRSWLPEVGRGAFVVWRRPQ